MNIVLERARPEDAEAIVSLINDAYRGHVGWTKETDLIGGDRTQLLAIKKLLSDSSIHFLVAHNLGELLSCICVEHAGKIANIGYFAVNPKLQNLKVGRSVLQQAENFAKDVFKVNKLAMQVVSQREELISYYQRRGYLKTNIIKPFPVKMNVGTPKISNLTIEVLEKHC